MPIIVAYRCVCVCGRRLDPLSTYLHWAFVIQLCDASPSLQQIIFQHAANTALNTRGIFYTKKKKINRANKMRVAEIMS